MAEVGKVLVLMVGVTVGVWYSLLVAGRDGLLLVGVEKLGRLL